MSEKPNVLLIITDHHAFHAHDRPGEYDYKWPRFERFCSEGVRFDRAYSVCPLCTPARASMMTGMYPSRHGMVWNTDFRHHRNIIDFRQGQQLYSHYLSNAGYRNGYVGKWHCGHERLPVDYGIEGWALPDYGRVYLSDAYKAYAEERGLGDARALIEHSLSRKEWEGQTLVLHDPIPWTFMNNSGILVGPAEAHEEQFVAHVAKEKLRELAQGSQPWSLVASFWGPHQAYFPTQEYADNVDPRKIPEYPTFRDDMAGRPLRHHLHWEGYPLRKQWDWSVWQEVLARCYAQALQLDDAIGSVLDTLEELGQSDNTIVIWCADHGDAVASHGGLWDKSSTLSEEVGRVPMAIRWPEGLAGGQRVGELVSNMDVTATILAAAGMDTPEDMASRSLLPLCRGDNAAWPDTLICEHNGHGMDLIQRGAYYKNYKYVAALFDGDELYDLEADPYETNNLIDSPDHRDVRADMRERIVRHIESTGNRERVLAYSLKKGF